MPRIHSIPVDEPSGPRRVAGYKERPCAFGPASDAAADGGFA